MKKFINDNGGCILALIVLFCLGGYAFHEKNRSESIKVGVVVNKSHQNGNLWSWITIKNSEGLTRDVRLTQPECEKYKLGDKIELDK